MVLALRPPHSGPGGAAAACRAGEYRVPSGPKVLEYALSLEPHVRVAVRLARSLQMRLPCRARGHGTVNQFTRFSPWSTPAGQAHSLSPPSRSQLFHRSCSNDKHTYIGARPCPRRTWSETAQVAQTLGRAASLSVSQSPPLPSPPLTRSAQESGVDHVS